MNLKKKKRPSTPPLGIPKTSSRSRVSKKPLQDLAHRRRVNGAHCLVCNWPPPSESHHIRECFPRTMSRRIGDDKVVPLCTSTVSRPGCHENLHKYSRRFWIALKLDPVPVAAALYAETLALRSKEGRQAIEQLQREDT